MCGYQPFILINQNQTLMGTIPTLGTFKDQDSNNLKKGDILEIIKP
jgi:hypothetical protein